MLGSPEQAAAVWQSRWRNCVPARSLMRGGNEPAQPTPRGRVSQASGSRCARPNNASKELREREHAATLKVHIKELKRAFGAKAVAPFVRENRATHVIIQGFEND